MQLTKILICAGIAIACTKDGHAQILKKLKDAANDAINKTVGDGGGSQSSPANGNNSSTSPGSNKAVNKGGQGLVTTPPDVKEHLTSAEAAFKSNNYNDARYAIQQAMLGVEMEIGQNILKSLPDALAGLPKNTQQDQVTSTGWGWVGLTIHREYGSGDKEFRVTIANNAVWMQAINLYFTSGAYSQSSGGNQQNWKQTKLKGNRAVIEYDENTGYKLSAPLGQTTLLVLEGVNFSTEAEFMKAANEIDLEKIKAHLGEK